MKILAEIAMRRYQTPTLLLGVFILGLGLRFIVWQQQAIGPDIQNFEISGTIVASGRNLFVEQPHYNYSPLPGIICAGLTKLPLPFADSFRLMVALVDFVNALLVGLIANKSTKRSVVIGTALLWLNPALIAFSYGEQFDTVAVLPILAAVWLVEEHKSTPLWFLGTLALFVKHIVLWHVWMLYVVRWGWKRGTLRIIASLALFALSFAPYLPQGAFQIWNQVIRYASSRGGYGLQDLLPPIINGVLFYGLMFALPVLYRRWHLDIVQLLLLTTAAFFLLIPGIADQTLLLAVTFGALLPVRWFLALSCAAFVSLDPTMRQRIGWDRHFMNLTWLVFAGWLLKLLLYRNPRVRRVQRGVLSYAIDKKS